METTSISDGTTTESPQEASDEANHLKHSIELSVGAVIVGIIYIVCAVCTIRRIQRRRNRNWGRIANFNYYGDTRSRAGTRTSLISMDYTDDNYGLGQRIAADRSVFSAEEAYSLGLSGSNLPNIARPNGGSRKKPAAAASSGLVRSSSSYNIRAESGGMPLTYTAQSKSKPVPSGRKTTKTANQSLADAVLARRSSGSRPGTPPISGSLPNVGISKFSSTAADNDASGTPIMGSATDAVIATALVITANDEVEDSELQRPGPTGTASTSTQGRQTRRVSFRDQ
jgi:hypothetical protein